MIDYGLIIEDPEIEDQVIERVQVLGRAGVNPSQARGLRFRPVSVLFETKRGRTGEDQAYMQLATWLSAQITLLRALSHLGDKLIVPSIPLVLVYGHEWRMTLADIRGPNKILLYEDMTMGSTESVLGIYSIMAGLRRLARWTTEVYQPWFLDNIL